MAIPVYESAHAGLKHMVLGVGILVGLAFYANFPAQVAGLMGKKDATAPRMIQTNGAKGSRCAAKTVETVFGKLGCGASKEAEHRAKTQFKMGS
jgi:hypothetical protein